VRTTASEEPPLPCPQNVSTGQTYLPLSADVFYGQPPTIIYLTALFTTCLLINKSLLDLTTQRRFFFSMSAFLSKKVMSLKGGLWLVKFCFKKCEKFFWHNAKLLPDYSLPLSRYPKNSEVISLSYDVNDHAYSKSKSVYFVVSQKFKPIPI